jgi:hypothetical protein
MPASFNSGYTCKLYRVHITIAVLIMISLKVYLVYLTKNEEKKYNTVRTVPKSKIKIVERNRIDTPNIQIYDLEQALR